MRQVVSIPKLSLCFSLLLSFVSTPAPFGGTAVAGPFNDPGHDPIAMVAWATAVDSSQVGPMDIAAPSLGDADFGVATNATGPVTGDNFDVFSLGDGGAITLFFDGGIENGIGDDLAVYENGFFSIGGLFAELAFVEVSTNGVDFARFPSTSVRLTPVAGGETADPTDYHYLAGDQPLNLGTGFDLTDLANDPLVIAGHVDLDMIFFVRVIDAIGDGSTLDAGGQPVYDPYPTAYPSGGFDIDGVGVLHEVPEPEGLALLFLGVGTLALLGRHRLQRDRCAQ